MMMQSMGHAFTGCGFYNIEVTTPRRGAGRSVHGGHPLLQRASVSGELKSLADELWDWQVTRLLESEFTGAVPVTHGAAFEHGEWQTSPSHE
jgi:hypothetical protein